MKRLWYDSGLNRASAVTGQTFSSHSAVCLAASLSASTQTSHHLIMFQKSKSCKWLIFCPSDWWSAWKGSTQQTTKFSIWFSTKPTQIKLLMTQLIWTTDHCSLVWIHRQETTLGPLQYILFYSSSNQAAGPHNLQPFSYFTVKHKVSCLLNRKSEFLVRL